MLAAFSEPGQTPDSEISRNKWGMDRLTREQFGRDQTIERKNDAIPDSFTKDGKNLTNKDSFDLIGRSEACHLTGYSRNTIFQMTSKKQIPFYKKPGGRRIFSLKELWNNGLWQGKYKEESMEWNFNLIV